MNTAENQAARLSQISAKIIGETVRSNGTRTFLSEVAQNFISAWANNGGIRARLATPAYWIASKILKPGKKLAENGISADIGRLLTIWARKINTEHARNPLCHAETRGETIHNFLSNTDFGEIREMVENSEECVLKTVEAFNTQVWKYPAKVGSILGTLLAATNTGIRSFREIFKPIEKNIGPDLLADLVLSLLKGLNAREAAALTNSLCEFIRRLHTGNLLLAKAGKPLFQTYLTELMQEALPDIDPTLLKKAKIALAEDSEAVANALADALAENPDLMMEMISAYGSVKSPYIKAASRKIRLFEDIDPDRLADATAQGFSDIDTFEIAEVINGFFVTINAIHSSRPEVFSTIACSVADSIDPQELQAAADWIIPEFVEANRPIIEAVMPSILNSLCDILRPSGGIMDERHRKAFANLKTALHEAGGDK